MRARGWITFAIMVVAVAAFARYLLARQESAALRAEIALLQQENDQVARLRAEHERLRAAKISDAELERLRSDRAALARLRAEINALEESAERKASRAQGETASKALPPLVLNLAMAGDGGWLIDGSPADQNALRQLLTDFARRSEQVVVRLHLDANEKRTELIKQTVEGIVQLGKEVGVKFTLRIETGQPR
jgi:small-conductance mechanosensitive channel